MTPQPRWMLATSPAAGSSAAIAVFHLWDLSPSLLSSLGFGSLDLGGVGLRAFGDVDRGVVARVTPGSLILMPHAGLAVRAGVIEWLTSHGVVAAEPADPQIAYPEASSIIEARMLTALERASSPDAIDLLLDQPARWALARHGAESDPSVIAKATFLNRLIDPPTVVAIGAPNIGKSTLLNALAGRSVSIVADQPGVTRDHVGVTIDLAGLVVHYIDTPGVIQGEPKDPIQRDAQRLALEVASRADLILVCSDASAREAGSVEALLSPATTPERVRIGLRADRGVTAALRDLDVSARTGVNIETLVATLRERLVPAGVLASPLPWKFWR